MCVASLGLGCPLGTPVASSPCTPSTTAACSARPLAAPPSAPPAACQRPECPSAESSRKSESASCCAARQSNDFGSQRCSPSPHPSYSTGSRLFAHGLGDRHGLLLGQHSYSCGADAPASRAGPRAGAHVPRSAYSSPAGGSSHRLPARELPAKRRAVDCTAAKPYEYAPRPRSAHCSPAGGSGRRLYTRAREQSRRNEIRRALHFNFMADTKHTELPR